MPEYPHSPTHVPSEETGHRNRPRGCFSGCAVQVFIGMIIIFVVGAIGNTFFGTDQAEPTGGNVGGGTPETATVLVTGSEGGTFDVAARDDGRTIGAEQNGTIGREPEVYELDLSGSIPEDATINALYVEARKTGSWDGNLSLVVKVDGDFIRCDDTSGERVRLQFDLGSIPTPNPGCRSQLIFY